MTDDDLQPRIEAGAAAERLLASEDYTAAIMEAQNRLMREWAQSEPDEAAKRERLYYEMRAIQQVDLSLRLRAEDGTVAKGILARIRKAVTSVFSA